MSGENRYEERKDAKWCISESEDKASTPRKAIGKNRAAFSITLTVTFTTQKIKSFYSTILLSTVSPRTRKISRSEDPSAEFFFFRCDRGK